MSAQRGMRVAIVGPCASGKSSLVKLLRQRGLNAYSVAQEHSAIDNLWEHLQPDAVVYLSVDLPTIRQRRHNPHWPEWLYHTQLERLSDARQRADSVVETDDLSPEQIVEQVVVDLAQREHGH